MFIIGFFLIIVSLYIFFKRNTSENEAIIASFLNLFGLFLGYTKQDILFQVFLTLFAMLPLIFLILVRTYEFIKNNKVIPGTAIKKD